ncbi:MAG: glycosyltransferase family 4 protein [Candidatus Moranbacteria bacterium]|nr:glycosyltransferase family 4 protein [Candidatus Moranbacteria bacterium]
MRILEVNKFCYGRRGAERHFLDVIGLLSRNGHDVAVFSMRDPRNCPTRHPEYLLSRAGFASDDHTGPREFAKGIGRLFWSFEGRRLMRRALEEFDPDIVHIHNAYHQLSPSFFPVIRNRGIPIVLTVHDYHIVSPDKDAYHDEVGTAYWKYLRIGRDPLPKRILLVLRAYADRLAGYYTRHVDVFIAPSRFVADTLIRAGIPARKIVVVPHFVSEEFLPEAGSRVRAEVGPYALYAGAVAPEKGIGNLVSVFEKLRYPLVLAGRRTMDIPSSRYVRYAGDLTREELGPLMDGASFVVSASRLNETFGLIALEANAAGKAFVGYSVGAFPEMIENGVNGWLADTDKSFERSLEGLISGRKKMPEAKSLRRRSRERYGTDRYLRSLESVFRDAIAKSRLRTR